MDAPAHADDDGDALTLSLAPALHILERFHHRNKNQHRTSKWWPLADMLRRHLRKLLHHQHQRHPPKSSSIKSAKKNERKHDGNEMMVARSEYLRRALVPRAYLSVPHPATHTKQCQADAENW